MHWASYPTWRGEHWIAASYQILSNPGHFSPRWTCSRLLKQSEDIALNLFRTWYDFWLRQEHKASQGYNLLDYCRRNTSTVMTWSYTTCFIIFTRNSQSNELQWTTIIKRKRKQSEWNERSVINKPCWNIL